MIVRDARHDESAAIGDIRVAAYVAAGMLPTSPYAEVLRSLGVSTPGEVLVADDGGTVMLEPLHRHSEIARSPGEAEVRALAVVPGAQGRGTGRALVSAVIERAALRSVRHLLLLTRPSMMAARHLYTRAGFSRLPGRDCEPVPNLLLLAYGLRFPPDARHGRPFAHIADGPPGNR